MYKKLFSSSVPAALIMLGIFGSFPYSCKTKTNANSNTNKKVDSLVVKSNSFAANGFIPSKYSCDAENISPTIKWSKGPDATKSYALICDDPDAPAKVWVHWVLFNIPSGVTKLDENIPVGENARGGALQGKNDSGEMGYSGPCPPSGTHHYHFKVYALDTLLPLKSGCSRDNVDAAMANHILAQGEIIGLYKRSK